MKNNYLFFILIIVIIIILTIGIYYYNLDRFDFNDDYKIFLSKEETQALIKQDADNYIKNLSVYDLRARNVKTNDEYLKIVIDSCMDFNKEQKQKLTICANEAKKFYDNKIDWTFAFVANNYEQGYPHTRGAVIFISNNTINSNNGELTKTLIHESVHIYQRYNKKEMEEYLSNNHFYISRKRDKNSLVRSNPDLDEYIYKDKDGVEMIANYTNENPKGINDITLKNLMFEHPFEKMAYEMGEEYSKSQLMKYRDI